MERRTDESGWGGVEGAGLGREGRGAGGGGDVGRLTWAMASGDPDAFARFYELWFDRVYAMARRATGRDEAFCLDVVQESFVKMIGKMRQIDSEAALAVWVRRLVTRTALDMMRGDARRAGREERKGRMTGHEEAAAEGETGETANLGARVAWLEEELGRLKREEAEMVLARHRFGWTLRAIGEAFGLSPGAVDGRLGRIVGRLRERAREEGHDD